MVDHVASVSATSNEHRAPARVRAHVFVQHRPEEENDARIRSEHAVLRERRDSHTRMPRVGPIRTARGIAVALERHERIRGDLELRRQHARRELGSQHEHALMEARLARRRPVQPAVGHGPRFERRERGRRQ